MTHPRFQISKKKLEKAKGILAKHNVGSHSENTVLHSCQLKREEVPKFLEKLKVKWETWKSEIYRSVNLFSYLKDVDKVPIGDPEGLNAFKYGKQQGKMMMPIRSWGDGRHTAVIGFILKEAQSDGASVLIDFNFKSTIAMTI